MLSITQSRAANTFFQRSARKTDGVSRAHAGCLWEGCVPNWHCIPLRVSERKSYNMPPLFPLRPSFSCLAFTFLSFFVLFFTPRMRLPLISLVVATRVEEGASKSMGSPTEKTVIKERILEKIDPCKGISVVCCCQFPNLSSNGLAIATQAVVILFRC